jgi:hypothetical protein
MNTFKHSGATGDLIYSLAIMKHLGGGDFRLHLNQMDWIGRHYYGAPPNPFHQGRLTQQDFDYMQDFMEAQDYINSFAVLDPADEVTHNLDRFRAPFVNHPGNYVDIYATVFGITDPKTQEFLRITPWLSVPEPNPVAEVVINRTARWCADPLPDTWRDLPTDSVVFVGLPQEHQQFEALTGSKISYYPTATQLELASVIAGADQFVGNQSQCLALAIGLGVNFACELRRDLPQERNECYFADHPNAQWF